MRDMHPLPGISLRSSSVCLDIKYSEWILFKQQRSCKLPLSSYHIIDVVFTDLRGNRGDHPAKDPEIEYRMDPSSPYDTMKIWRVKTAIINPPHAEHCCRLRQETKAAVSENRKCRKVPFPPSPTYDPRSGNINYQDYANETIRK